MRVLNLGEIELVDHMGSDLAVVQGARISNGAALPDWRGAPDERLIKFLVEHDHLSPFEHATFKFYVKAPIFVIREWMRHRTFSYNEMSARYKKLRPEFYYPSMARVQDPENKQGSIYWDDPELTDLIQLDMKAAYEAAWFSYERMLEEGIAREMARAVLPVGIYSEMYVTGNFRNWMHFCSLRTHPDAQAEIREYARAAFTMIEEKMPLSTEEFRKKFMK